MSERAKVQERGAWEGDDLKSSMICKNVALNPARTYNTSVFFYFDF